MMRMWIRAGSASFWALIAAWILADRAAHGDAVGALPLAATLFAAGVLASFLLTLWSRSGRTVARPVVPISARAARLGNLLIAAICAITATIAFTPFEICVRAQPGDSWWVVAGRCLLHPGFAFAASLTIVTATRSFRRAR